MAYLTKVDLWLFTLIFFPSCFMRVFVIHVNPFHQISLPLNIPNRSYGWNIEFAANVQWHLTFDLGQICPKSNQLTYTSCSILGPGMSKNHFFPLKANVQCVPIKRKPVLSVRYLHCHARVKQTVCFIIKSIFSSFI